MNVVIWLFCFEFQHLNKHVVQLNGRFLPSELQYANIDNNTVNKFNFSTRCLGSRAAVGSKAAIPLLFMHCLMLLPLYACVRVCVCVWLGFCLVGRSLVPFLSAIILMRKRELATLHYL